MPTRRSLFSPRGEKSRAPRMASRVMRPASGPAAKADSGPWWSGMTTDQPAPTSEVICRTSYVESADPVSAPGIDACCNAYDGAQ